MESVTVWGLSERCQESSKPWQWGWKKTQRIWAKVLPGTSIQYVGTLTSLQPNPGVQNAATGLQSTSCCTGERGSRKVAHQQRYVCATLLKPGLTWWCCIICGNETQCQNEKRKAMWVHISFQTCSAYFQDFFSNYHNKWMLLHKKMTWCLYMTCSLSCTHQSQHILDWFLSTSLHYLCGENILVLGVPIMQFTYSSCLEFSWGGLSAISKRQIPPSQSINRATSLSWDGRKIPWDYSKSRRFTGSCYHLLVVLLQILQKQMEKYSLWPEVFSRHSCTW